MNEAGREETIEDMSRPLLRLPLGAGDQFRRHRRTRCSDKIRSQQQTTPTRDQTNVSGDSPLAVAAASPGTGAK
jgi:hypothetical protein